MNSAIVAARRTPIDELMGALSVVSGVDLGSAFAEATFDDLPLEDFADLIKGNFLQVRNSWKTQVIRLESLTGPGHQR